MIGPGMVGPGMMGPGAMGAPSLMGPGVAGMDPLMLRDVYASQHAAYLQQQRANEPNNGHYVEPPSKRVRYIDEWLNLHFKIIQRLVEEPMFAAPKVGEPVLEVCVAGAQLYGPWPHPFLNDLKDIFVRHYIDTEMVGETKKWEEDMGDPRCPNWNHKMLVLPRGAKVSQFEVLNGTSMPLVIGDCAFNTETLWKCAQDCGRYALNTPISSRGARSACCRYASEYGMDTQWMRKTPL